MFHPKIVQRSQSGNHKKSGPHLQHFHQSNAPSLFNTTIHKEVSLLIFLETKCCDEENDQGTDY